MWRQTFITSYHITRVNLGRKVIFKDAVRMDDTHKNSKQLAEWHCKKNAFEKRQNEKHMEGKTTCST